MYDDKGPVDLEGSVWLRREALADGLSDRQIARLVHDGSWHRVRRGAYCSGELWRELSVQDRHRVLCRAVLRAAHPDTVLSHTSAVVERGVPVWGVSLGEVHTTRTDGRCGRREAGVRHHRGVLPEHQVEIVNGLPVTTAARTVVEVCTVAGLEPSLVAACGMIHAGHTSVDEVGVLAEDTRYWPASLNTRLVRDLVDPRLESVGEIRTWFFLWSQHLPRPVPQYEVRDEHQRVVARLDFAWPQHGVFLEFDGRRKYTHLRRDGETLDQFIMREKRREELVCLLTGWVCLRIGWGDLDRPERVAKRIRAVLAGRPNLAG